MDENRMVELIQQVMGASHLFSSSVNDVLEGALKEATDQELTMSQVKLLLLISNPGQRFKVMDVAEFLGVTNAAASRSIDRLVQRGLVDRTVTPEDRRAVDLTLTPLAEDLLGRFAEARNRELTRRLGHHSAQSMERAFELMERATDLMLQLTGFLNDPGTDPERAEPVLRDPFPTSVAS
jgi:DNA-binding MarR family transcriptional regulator